MLYLHEFAYQVPDILHHALTQLNADAFYESISDDEEGTAVGHGFILFGVGRQIACCVIGSSLHWFCVVDCSRRIPLYAL